MSRRSAVRRAARRVLPASLRDRLRPLLDRQARQWRAFRRTGQRFEPELADFPPMVMLETTTRCNLECRHCPNHELAGEPGFLGDMDPELFRGLVDQIAAEAPDTVVRPFDGGEPLMRRDLAELIAYARSSGLTRVGLNTNGTLLDERRRAELIAAGLEQLEVSIDAARAETYRRLRGADLDRVRENTQRYIAEARAAGLQPRVTVSFVRQPDNQAELDEFRAFWEPRCQGVLVREYHQHHGRTGASGAGPDRPAHRHPCPYLWNRLIVHHDGRVRFCEMDWTAEHALGHAAQQSLREIWRGPEYTRLRQQHVAGRLESPFCRDCPDWPLVTWE